MSNRCVIALSIWLAVGLVAGTATALVLVLRAESATAARLAEQIADPASTEAVVACRRARAGGAPPGVLDRCAREVPRAYVEAHATQMRLRDPYYCSWGLEAAALAPGDARVSAAARACCSPPVDDVRRAAVRLCALIGVP